MKTKFSYSKCKLSVIGLDIACPLCGTLVRSGENHLCSKPEHNPRFVIINTIDAPERRHVAELVDGVGYCYMSRVEEPNLKRYDGMNPDNPTSIEDFGFEVKIEDNNAVFTKAHNSTALYEDGQPRRWQDYRHPEQFMLPLVKGVKKKGSAHKR